MTEQRMKAAFDTVHADEELKQRTRDYLARTIYEKKRRVHPAVRALPALAACLLLTLCLGGGYLYFVPTAYISVDINPSLELRVNRFDRVVDVEAYNEDGQALAEALDLKYLDVREALEQLVSDSEMEGYLQDGALSLTVAGENENQCAEIYQVMEECASGQRNIRCHASSAGSVEEAHSHGMSVGKYQAYLILRELDQNITVEEVQGMTMWEIDQFIQAHIQEESGSPATRPEDPGGEFGGYHHEYGHHHGRRG